MNSINTETVENVEFSIQNLIQSWCIRRKWRKLFIFCSKQHQRELISNKPQWRITLTEFLESYQVHIFTIFLLSLDIILTSIELSSSLLSCTSVNKTKTKTENEWFGWGGAAILSILAIRSMALAAAMGKSFFRQPGCVMDGVVAIIALILQVFLDKKGIGFIVVVSLWRVLRVVETAFEISDEAIEMQIDGLIRQFQDLSKENKSLLENLAEKDEVIKKLEEELNLINLENLRKAM